MSSSKISVLNCGASQLALGVFSTDGAEPVLERLVVRDLDYDFSEEEQWLSATLGALRNAVSEAKVSGEVRVVLPGFLLLSKTLRIAHVDGPKQAQMVAYEAQQTVPYQLSELNWSYQVLSDDGIETEVLFIGIRTNICQRFCDEVTKMGIRPVSVNASTILDYNAFQITHPDEADTLVINIGARASNLTFVQESGFFVRNINLGGNALTQSIADSLGKSFSEAEAIKVVYFSSGNEVGSSGDVLDKASQGFMRRLSQEITRSIINFRQQKKGAAPQRILLTGRCSLVPGLAEYLAESQRVEVDFFKPMEQVATSPDLDLGEMGTGVPLQLSELIGEAGKERARNGVGVDLLPEYLRREMAFKRRRGWFVAAALLLAAAPIPFYLQARQETEKYQAAAREVRTHLPPLEEESERMEQILREIEEARTRVERFDDLVLSRANWIFFFSELQEALFDIGDAWLDELRVNRMESDGQVRYQLMVEGRILVRPEEEGGQVDSTRIDRTLLSNRIRTLSDRFIASPFIDERISLRIDFQAIQAGQPLLPFELVYSVEPDRPL